ncbi:Nucleotide-binding universal stress protein, UspA family [Actinomadura meyerae]|jgi:nucleotide-binding universal stress UspA family protein|uniref:Nucleotide-binding universal stress protein, UspA family n=1 Tax=Actinomadura meyerae TaxID=240840 RepID=A0A239GRV3_9ACTN|nr:universal stress protein [Actinomadura meyerae]SNS71949.1 Nucleotide-binding universal stress protein, UspA family [Actinomadura meyerae]
MNARENAADGMRVLVGYAPDERGDDALALAALLARTMRAPLTAVHVHPPPWPTPGPGAVDAEWVAYLKGQADEALDAALARLAEFGVPRRDVTPRVHAHRGSGRGLIEVAKDTGADLIVAGSAPRGRRGRVAVGSTADQLLHGSPVPVMLAPRGYAAHPPRRFSRMTVAYLRRRGADGPPDAEGPLSAAAAIAERLGVELRLLTLVLRPPGLAARFRVPGGVLDRQLAQAEEDLRYAAGLFGGGTPVERVTAIGTDIAKTLGTVDMLHGEILTCLSGHDAPLRKVFLGESSGKILRAAPCPVLLLPRGAAVPVSGEKPQVR